MWKVNWSFRISLQSLKFTFLFTDHTYKDFDSADPSSLQNACHIWTQLNDHALHEFS